MWNPITTLKILKLTYLSPKIALSYQMKLKVGFEMLKPGLNCNCVFAMEMEWKAHNVMSVNS